MHTNDTDVIATGIQYCSVKQVGDVWSATQLHTTQPKCWNDNRIYCEQCSDTPIMLSAVAAFFFPCHPFHCGTGVGLLTSIVQASTCISSKLSSLKIIIVFQLAQKGLHQVIRLIRQYLEQPYFGCFQFTTCLFFLSYMYFMINTGLRSSALS